MRALLLGFLGKKRANQALRTFATRFPDALPPREELTTSPHHPLTNADPRLLTYAEKLLAGSLGPASARMLVASVAGAEEISYDSVVGILRESQQLMEANRQLQKQSRQLQRLTDELRAAYDQLQALDQRKDEFLYTVTHELRTPLTSIRALAEILADNPDLEEGERQHFQLTIGREAERLTRLISLVLDLEKFESGQATLDRTPIAMPELVAEALDAVGQLLRDKHIAIHTEISQDLLMLFADRDRLMQVLVNLLSNAIKACQSDGMGRIAVRAWPTADALLLCVEDNGRGIAPAAQHHIFDKFFQAPNQTTRKPEGSGLGLAITRKIVELHHGRIWVESSPEQGARFFIELPLAGSEEGGSARHAERSEASLPH